MPNTESTSGAIEMFNTSDWHIVETPGAGWYGFTFDASRVARTASETRVASISLYYGIKY
jgi:hypothetical protein